LGQNAVTPQGDRSEGHQNVEVLGVRQLINGDSFVGETKGLVPGAQRQFEVWTGRRLFVSDLCLAGVWRR